MQLIFAIAAYIYEGPSDQNTIAFAFFLFFPFTIIIIIAWVRVQNAVNNNMISHAKGYVGFYIYLLLIFGINITSLLWKDYTIYK